MKTSIPRALVRAGLLSALLTTAHEASAQFWNWHEAPCGSRPAHRNKVERSSHCRVSVTLSPYHLGYPMLVGTLEGRVSDRLGVSVTHGMGSYRGGLVGHWGVATPFYPLGGFEGGLQLGPFGRLTRFAFRGDSSSTAPASVDSAHRISTPVFHDVETGRANGQDVFYAGVLIGGKFVVGHRGARAPTPAWTRGITIQMGLMAGQLVPVGETGLGPHPLASRTATGFSGQVYADVGCSF